MVSSVYTLYNIAQQLAIRVCFESAIIQFHTE